MSASGLRQDAGSVGVSLLSCPYYLQACVAWNQAAKLNRARPSGTVGHFLALLLGMAEFTSVPSTLHEPTMPEACHYSLLVETGYMVFQIVDG